MGNHPCDVVSPGSLRQVPKYLKLKLILIYLNLNKEVGTFSKKRVLCHQTAFLDSLMGIPFGDFAVSFSSVFQCIKAAYISWHGHPGSTECHRVQLSLPSHHQSD